MTTMKPDTPAETPCCYPHSVRTENWDMSFGGRVVNGLGTAARLGPLLAEKGAQRVLLVTDPGLRRAGLIDGIVSSITGNGVTVVVHSDIPPNPSTASVDVATEDARNSRADHILAVGGGSALDAAKAVALLASSTSSAEELARGEALTAGALPIVAVPTTAGTGAETNGFGVLESVDRRKVYLGNETTVPWLVVLDAELTLGLPAQVTAASGFDAVIHGAESLLSEGATTISRAYAAESLRLTTSALVQAVRDGGDVEARCQMLLGAHLAGRALTLSGLGLVHGIGHSITATLGTPHGVALAAIAGPAMRFGVDAEPHRYQELARALDVGGPGCGERAVDVIADLAARVGLPTTVGEVGLTGDLVDTIVEKTLADPVTRNTPKPPTASELAAMLRAELVPARER